MNILITGGTSGIGYALCKRLVKQGHYIFLCVHSDNEIEPTVERVKDINYLDRISVMKLDVTKKRDRKLVLKLDIDCLVNLAGVGIGGSLINLDIKDIKYNFDVNFFGSLELVKLYIKSRKNSEGKVVITSSLAGFIPIPFLGSYCSSKAALISFFECLNKEIKKASLNIKFKLIIPGAYYTGFNQYMIENKDNLDYSEFNDDVETIIEKQKKLFSFVEKKSLSSVVNAFDTAINSEGDKFKYRVPVLQTLFAKLYLLLFK